MRAVYQLEGELFSAPEEALRPLPTPEAPATTPGLTAKLLGYVEQFEKQGAALVELIAAVGEGIDKEAITDAAIYQHQGAQALRRAVLK